MAGDPYWNETVLLLHCNGSNGSTAFTDQKGKTVTANGNAQISTAQSMFGGASGLLDGNGDSLSIASHADLNFGTGDFTIEGWLYLLSATQDTFASILASGQTTYQSGCRYLMVGSTRNLRIGGHFGAGSVDIAAAGDASVPANTWIHFAATRIGTTVRVFLGGELKGTGSSPAAFDFSTTATYLGKNGWDGASGELYAHFDDIRVTKGIGRYSANFTPPAAAFPDAITKLSGIVRDHTNMPCQRLVRAYRSDTGVLAVSGNSDPGTGAYSLDAGGNLVYDLRFFDSTGNYNDIVLSDVVPI